MNLMQRMRSILTGLFMFLGSAVLLLNVENGMYYVAAILGITFMVRGVGLLSYYCTMARYMVGGKAMLYFGIIYLDLGSIVWSVLDESRFFVILYLTAVHGFSGLVHLLRGRDAYMYGGPSWKFSTAYGVVKILAAVLCVASIHSPQIPVYIYCVGLVCSGCMRIADAFRKTAIVYIQ